MVNTCKLKGKIAENGLTLGEVSQMIGINICTMSRKMRNVAGQGFTIKQADDLVKILNLTPDEAMSIFFSQFVAEMR